MITVFGGGTSRSLRVTWLLEEMGLAYRLRPVDLLSGQEDAEFLAVNPAGFIPVLQDGDVTMVESVAIMEYLMARYGPTPLAPAPSDPAFPVYLQFLHLGEAGLAASIYFVGGARNFAPEAERQNWSAGQALDVFETDISVTYALLLATSFGGITLDGAEQAYFDRTRGREAYKRALETSQAAMVPA
jgi:glutathione S-transferase